MEHDYISIMNLCSKIIVGEPSFEKRIKKVLLLLFQHNLLSDKFILIFGDDSHFILFTISTINTIDSRCVVVDIKHIKDNYLHELLAIETSDWFKSNVICVYNHFYNKAKLPDIEVFEIKCVNKIVGALYIKRSDFNDEMLKYTEVLNNILTLAAAPKFIASNEHLEITNDIISLLDIGSNATTNFYYKLISTCASIFKAEAASLYLETSDKSQLKAVAGVGYGEKWVDEISYHKDEGKGITQYIWRGGKPFRWFRTTKELKCDFPDLVEDKGKATNCRSLIAVPVNCGGKCVGVLKVENKKDEQNYIAFTEVDQRRLETIAQVLAGNLEDIRSANNYNKISYSDVNVYDRQFFEDVFYACAKLVEDCSNSCNNETIARIQLFTEILKQAKCKSRDESFEYIQKFNADICSIFGFKNKLNGLLQNNLANVEKALYTIPKYRDHMIHQTQVFLLGFLILANLKLSLMKRSSKVSDKIGFNDGTWIKRWYLASAFHDIGYAFEKVDSWHKLLFKNMLNNPDQKPNNSKNKSEQNKNSNQPLSVFNWSNVLVEGEIGAHMETLLDHLNHVLDINTVDKKYSVRKSVIQHTLVEPNHATMSSLIFLNFSDMDSYINPIDQIMIKDAAVAICLHSLKVAESVRKAVGGESHKINFEEAPLAFLLAFCDTVQEWGRNTPNSIENTAIYGTPRYNRAAIDDNGVKINLSYGIDESLVSKWKTEVFNWCINPLKDCWHGNDKFKIYYYNNKVEKGSKLEPGFMDKIVL